MQTEEVYLLYSSNCALMNHVQESTDMLEQQQKIITILKQWNISNVFPQLMDVRVASLHYYIIRYSFMLFLMQTSLFLASLESTMTRVGQSLGHSIHH